jgi:uncharacterized membrane protein YdfJ with MMPL/SSD domain
MTEPELKAIEERESKATKGPWTAWLGTVYVGEVTPKSRGVLEMGYDCEDAEQAKADARFSAHARTDVPNLVKALRSANAEIERMRGEMRRMSREHAEDERHLRTLAAMLPDCVPCGGTGEPGREQGDREQCGYCRATGKAFQTDEQHEAIIVSLS